VVTLLGDRLDDSTRVRGAVQRSLMLRIKDYIHQRFSDPALGPAEIAAAVNISTRYLHKLFETDHQTVSLYIKGLRLDRAQRDLLDPRLADRPISAIAYSCGFGDLSGFNRAFKQAYAVSPSELRNTSATTAQPAPSKPGDPGHG
jgi:AraC-like DNA-binding protein